MKKFIFSTLFILILALLSGCGSKIDKQYVGTWNIEESTVTLDDEEPMTYDAKGSHVKTHIEISYNGEVKHTVKNMVETTITKYQTKPRQDKEGYELTGEVKVLKIYSYKTASDRGSIPTHLNSLKKNKNISQIKETEKNDKYYIEFTKENISATFKLLNDTLIYEQEDEDFSSITNVRSSFTKQKEAQTN
ncbi:MULTISPECIES: lipoprotein [unclassified Listeria]|uniref:LptM family lipoprotein n=1 Tax=unclassified Listeria TaxID=2642072 RepID=UPI000B595835|nr:MULTISPECIES: hypothetical protein [unclassified Listeria]